MMTKALGKRALLVLAAMLCMGEMENGTAGAAVPSASPAVREVGSRQGDSHTNRDFFLAPLQDAQGRDEVIQSLLVMERGVYLLSGRKHLYLLHPDTRAASAIAILNTNPAYEQVPSDILAREEIAQSAHMLDYYEQRASGIDQLLTDGRDLYGLNNLTGAFYRLVLKDETATLAPLCRLDFSIEGGRLEAAGSGAILQSAVYLTAYREENTRETAAFSFDMRSGKRTPLTSEGTVREIAPYQGNRLLLLEALNASHWRILALDAATGRQSPLYDESLDELSARELSGLVYDPWRDRVLVQAEEKVIALAGKASRQVVSYVQPDMSSYCRGLLPDGTLLMARKNLYGRCVLYERPERRPLRVACGDLPFSVIQDCARIYPELLLEHVLLADYEVSSVFAEEMNLKSSEIDIFALPIHGDTRRALDKGYYTALDHLPAVRQMVEECRPFIAGALTAHGDIAAIPRELRQNTLAYSQYAMARLRLTQQDMPLSLEELLDFLLAWDERAGEAASQAGITPFAIPNGDVKAELLRMILFHYEARMEQDPLAEAALARLLNKLSQACAVIPEPPFSDPLAKALASGPEYRKYEVNTRPAYLFSLDGSFLPKWRNFSYRYESLSDFVPVNLSTLEGETPLMLLQGTVFVLNPYSTLKEQAERFLSCYAQCLPAREAASLLKNAKPIESELYKLMGYRYTAEMEDLTARLKNARGAERSELEAQIEMAEEKLKSRGQIRWDISAKAIETYGDAWERSVPYWLNQTDLGQSFHAACQQYLNGGDDGTALAGVIVKSYRMIVLESS